MEDPNEKTAPTYDYEGGSACRRVAHLRRLHEGRPPRRPHRQGRRDARRSQAPAPRARPRSAPARAASSPASARPSPSRRSSRGRLVACVANLAPRKMRFGVSEAMVIAAGEGKGRLRAELPGRRPPGRSDPLTHFRFFELRPTWSGRRAGGRGRARGRYEVATLLGRRRLMHSSQALFDKSPSRKPPPSEAADFDHVHDHECVSGPGPRRQGRYSVFTLCNPAKMLWRTSGLSRSSWWMRGFHAGALGVLAHGAGAPLAGEIQVAVHVGDDVGLGDERERPNQRQPALEQLLAGRHRRDVALEEQVHEGRLATDVVEVGGPGRACWRRAPWPGETGPVCGPSRSGGSRAGGPRGRGPRSRARCSGRPRLLAGSRQHVDRQAVAAGVARVDIDREQGEVDRREGLGAGGADAGERNCPCRPRRPRGCGRRRRSGRSRRWRGRSVWRPRPAGPSRWAASRLPTDASLLRRLLLGDGEP